MAPSRSTHLREAMKRLMPHVNALRNGALCASALPLETSPPSSLSESLAERWHLYAETLRPLLEEVAPSWIALRVVPSHRVLLGAWLRELAIARLNWSLYPAQNEALEEIALWELGFALDRYGTERAMHDESWDVSCGFVSPSQRLADLYRRLGRTDPTALALLIEFVNDDMLLNSVGAGGHFNARQLIYEGACITSATHLSEVRLRHGLCLRLKMRRFEAPWVAESLRYVTEQLVWSI